VIFWWQIFAIWWKIVWKKEYFVTNSLVFWKKKKFATNLHNCPQHECVLKIFLLSYFWILPNLAKNSYGYQHLSNIKKLEIGNSFKKNWYILSRVFWNFEIINNFLFFPKSRKISLVYTWKTNFFQFPQNFCRKKIRWYYWAQKTVASKTKHKFKRLKFSLKNYKIKIIIKKEEGQQSSCCCSRVPPHARTAQTQYLRRQTAFALVATTKNED